MLTNLRVFLAGIILTGSLLSCSDHLAPQVPARVRLKTLEKVNLSTTTFNYDRSNRLLSYNDGTLQYFYDDQGRIARYDLSTPSTTDGYDFKRFSYYANSNSYDIGFYTFNGRENKYETRFYTVDVNKHVTGFTNDGQVAYMTQSYQYTGDNITTAVFTVGRYQETRLYEFDNKPNPYYGLIVPGVDDFLTYSRNNVTKIIGLSREGTQYVIAEYVYQYNEQGLPTKMSEKNGRELFLFAYESY